MNDKQISIVMIGGMVIVLVIMAFWIFHHWEIQTVYTISFSFSIEEEKPVDWTATATPTPTATPRAPECGTGEVITGEEVFMYMRTKECDIIFKPIREESSKGDFYPLRPHSFQGILEKPLKCLIDNGDINFNWDFVIFEPGEIQTVPFTILHCRYMFPS